MNIELTAKLDFCRDCRYYDTEMCPFGDIYPDEIACHQFQYKYERTPIQTVPMGNGTFNGKYTVKVRAVKIRRD